MHVATIGARLPGGLAVLYAVMGRSVRVGQRVGTVAVTAIGMFAAGGGFGIAPPTLMSLQIVGDRCGLEEAHDGDREGARHERADVVERRCDGPR